MSSIGALIKNEFIKTFRKKTVYISFIALTILVVALQYGFKHDGDEIIKFFISQIEEDFSINGNLLTSNFICYLILQFLIIQMPLLVTLVSGDVISGEHATGTLRYLLMRPQSRGQIYFAKWIVSMSYTLMLLIWLGILALVVSRFIFPAGDLMAAFSDGIHVTRDAECIPKFLQAFGIAFLALGLITSFAMMLSAIAENSIAPIIIVMSTVIIFTVLSTFDLPVFDVLKPFMFTTHMIVWRSLFEQPVSWPDILVSCGIMLAHIIGFYFIGYYYFKKKDISC
jgi:ABC-2 type transport system permease protein